MQPRHGFQVTDGKYCKQPDDFQLDRNSLYGEIYSGKGVRNNREFVIPVFVICVNTYNGKDREKSVLKKLFRYICQFVVSVFVISLLHCICMYIETPFLLRVPCCCCYV